MISEEGVQGQEVSMEVEVGTSEVLQPAGGSGTTSRFRGPLLPSRFPFRTAKGFGNWIYSKLALMPDQFHGLHSQLRHYCVKFDIKKLVENGIVYFNGYDRLCYLYGVHLIAISAKQKMGVRRAFVEEMAKMLKKD